MPTVGIFVTAKATTDGDGSISAPVRTISVALDRARALKIPVYVCAESYEENLELADGVAVDGNWNCDGGDWKRSGSRATVRAPKSPAVHAVQLTAGAQLKGFDVYAPDLSSTTAMERSGSSIALFIDRSKVDVSGSSFHGGNAAPGVNGTEGQDNAETGSPNGAAGKAQTTNCQYGVVQCNTFIAGAAGGTSICKSPDTTGGPGGASGDGPIEGVASAANSNGRPFTASAVTAKGGPTRVTAELPHPGDNGAPGTDGADGTNGSWAFDEQGYKLVAATNGKNGAGGQGGGGGGSQPGYTTNGTSSSSPANPPGNVNAATGSGGGAGGCGGFAGTAGTGGGASIGALVINGTVTFSKVEIASGTGGAAGRGTLGGSPLKGGGSPLPPQYGAQGGAGGDGGLSGLSGNGAAGPSVALVFTGTRPVTTDVTLTPGPGGAAAPELRKKTKSLPSTTGDSKSEHSF